MPLQWRLQVLETQLRRRLARPVWVEEADLYGLQGAARHAALDALVAGNELPFVLVGDVVACSGALDADRIEDAILRM